MARTRKKRSSPRKRRSKKRHQRVPFGRNLFIFILASFVIAGGGFLYQSWNKKENLKSPQVYEIFPSSRLSNKIHKIEQDYHRVLFGLGIHKSQIHFIKVDVEHKGSKSWEHSYTKILCSSSTDLSRLLGKFKVRLRNITKNEVSIKQKKLSYRHWIVQLYLYDLPVHTITFIKKPPKPVLPIPKPLPHIRPEERPRPKVAIIIDDMGHDFRKAKEFLSLDYPLSFSILPFSPYGAKIAEEMHKYGRDVLVHLPMEPNDIVNHALGPGALLTTMDHDHLIEQLKKDINAVPFCIGANNHMGSLFTTDRKRMRCILTTLKEKGMFFVDSLTSTKSVAEEISKEIGILFVKRDIFLDHFQDEKFLNKQLNRTIKIAKRRGFAVAIGHPYPITIVVLKKRLKEMAKEVKIVSISELLKAEKVKASSYKPPRP